MTVLNKQGWVGIIDTIQRMYLVKENVFLPYNLWVNNTMWPFNHLPPAIWSFLNAYNFARQTFEPSQFNEDFSVSLFDMKIRQQCHGTVVGLPIRNCPRIKRLAFLCRWFFDSVVTIKTVIQKFWDVFRNLFEPYLFRVNGLTSIPSYSQMISATLDSKVAIGIKATCQICFGNFIHAYIISYSIAGYK